MAGQGLKHLVRECSDADEMAWDRFVESSPDGTFFHSYGWRRIFENSLRHRAFYLLSEREGQVTGVLPTVQVKSVLFGNALISTPFLVYGGVVAVDAAAEGALAEAAVSKANELGVDYIEFRSREPSDRAWTPRHTHATFRKELDADPEKNLLAIPRKQRAMVRKGIKAGLTAETDRDVSRLYQALLECKRNLGTPFFGRSYLEAVCEEFGDKAEILTVTQAGRAICSVMSFRFRDEILPYYGGGGELARQYYGNDYMYWAVMERACQEGVRLFDYGRSAIGSGAYRFKKHWGFEPSPLGYEVLPIGKATVPDVTPDNAKFQLPIRLWKRLPLAVASRLGPLIARQIG